jgi:hypothetical protein
MWVILQSALEEFGLRGANELAPDVVQDVERQVFDEALLGALRIAGLVRHSQSLFPKTDFPLDLDQRFDIERLSASGPKHSSLQYIRSWDVLG